MSAPSDSAGPDLTSSYQQEFGPVDHKSVDGTQSAEDGKYPKDSRAAKAYEVALDTRKFELELFWKRAGYFWLLVAALTTALGLVVTASSSALLSSNRREYAALFISCSGTVVSLAWSLVNSASKVWQRNWELQVDLLENLVVGPLYKSVLFRDTLGLPIYYSVSDVSIWISYYFVAFFSICAAFFSDFWLRSQVDWIKVAILLFNVAFVVMLMINARRIQSEEVLNVDVAYSRRKVTIRRRFPSSD